LTNEETRAKEPIEMLIKHMAVHIKDSSLVGGEKAHHISEGMSFTIGSAPPERVKLSLPNEKTDGHIQVFDKTGKVLPVEGKISLENGKIYYTNYNENGVQLIDSDGKLSAGVYRIGARLLVDPSQIIMLSGVYPVRIEIKEAEIELGEREQVPLQAKSEREILRSIMARNFDLDLRGVMKLIDDVSAILEKEKQAGKLGIGIDKEGVSVKGMMTGENGVAHLPKEGEAIIVGRLGYAERALLETHFVDRVLNGEKLYLVLTGGYIDRLGNVESEETQKLLGLALGLKKEFTNNVVILSERQHPEGAAPPQPQVEIGIQYGEEGRAVVAEKYRRLFEQMPNAVKMENGISVTSQGAENTAKDLSEVINPGEKRAYAVVDLSKGADDPNQVQIGYF
jgi:hypothetical protein